MRRQLQLDRTRAEINEVVRLHDDVLFVASCAIGIPEDRDRSFQIIVTDHSGAS